MPIQFSLNTRSGLRRTHLPGPRDFIEPVYYLFPKIFAVEFREAHHRVVLKISLDALERRRDGGQTAGDVFNHLGDKRAVRPGGFLVRHDANARIGQMPGNLGVRHKTRRLKFETGNLVPRVVQETFQRGGLFSDEPENGVRPLPRHKSDRVNRDLPETGGLSPGGGCTRKGNLFAS